MPVRWVVVAAVLCASSYGERDLTASEERELDDWAKIDEANAARCQQDPNALCNGYHVIVKDGRVYEGSLWAVADKPYRWCSYLLTRGMSDFGRNMCLASVKIYEVGEEPRSLTPAECDAIDKWVGAVI
ncbi:hypothetical protein AAVH_19191 [Aphelenchoides avenae]|nr:hypothetical protein AAVH_19191 [Aphelenchus avenae]